MLGLPGVLPSQMLHMSAIRAEIWYRLEHTHLAFLQGSILATKHDDVTRL